MKYNLFVRNITGEWLWIAETNNYAVALREYCKWLVITGWYENVVLL